MQPEAVKEIHIYTDGACLGNPGPGGWGVVMLAPDETEEWSGAEAATTNNRMELLGAIMGLEKARRHRCPLHLYTDSQYVKQGITLWIRQWKRNGWRTAKRQEVKNQDLWRRLDALNAENRVEWHWVKAHANNAHNNRADALAGRAAAQVRAENERKLLASDAITTK